MNRKTLTSWAGMIAPILFVGVFTLEGWMRAGYSSKSDFVSELSLGERGLIQIANFIVFGILLFIFSTRVKVGRTLLKIIALGYLFSGVFVTDASTIFFGQHSVHGIIHGILGAMVFVLMPAYCFVVWKGFSKEREQQVFTIWTLVLAVVITAGVVWLTVATKIPSLESTFDGWLGLIQRASIIPFMAWLLTFAIHDKDERHTF